MFLHLFLHLTLNYQGHVFDAGSVSATEDIIEKHLKVMDKIDKKKNDVKAIITKGEKLESMPKAPVSCYE